MARLFPAAARMRTLSIPSIFIALALSCVTTGRAGAQAPPRREVEDVELEGVRALDERLVRATIVTRESRCRSPLLFLPCALGAGERKAYLDRVQVTRDVARIDSLYEAWGYPAAEVSSEIRDLSDGAAVVTFRVVEGTPLIVRSVTVTGLESVPGTDVGELPLRVGEPYALARLEESQRRIAAALAERGYPFARVGVGGDIAQVQSAADVVLEVEPGPAAVFGATEVRTQAPLDEDEVRDRLAYRPGDPFRPEALRRSVEALYDLPIVAEARLDPAAGAPGDSAVRTVVTVTRSRLSAAQGDIYYSSGSCLGGTVNLSHRYVLGAPRVLTASVGATNLGAGRVCAPDEGDEFEEPGWFVRAGLREPLAPRTWLIVDGEVSREASTRAYVRRGGRGRAALAAPLGRSVFGEGGVAFDQGENEAAGPLFCVLVGACAGAALEAATGETTLVPLDLQLGWQPPGARRARLAPVPAESASVLPAGPRWIYGARAALSAASDAVGSDLGFARGTAEASLARPLGGRTEVAARIRLGALAGSDRAPPQTRLYGGGPRGVRGAAPNLLGPRYLLVRDDDGDGGTAEDLGCAIEAGGCEGVEVDPEDVIVRALGGNALVETSVEARFWAARWLQLAAFVDVGGVWARDADGGLPGARSQVLATPGVGVLALLPIGPVRIDVAYDPSPARRLPLLADDPDGDGFIYLGQAVYDPFEFGEPSPLRRLWRRLQLQLSLGQPF